ncbi:MAG: FAD:protein FMN transferase [Chloroflexi bacterium]|nr:MAG: FAD:protein FMN transferase [Chloroflexota bacterium]
MDIGGDMYACGAPEGYEGWPIEVENPLDGAAITTIVARDMAVMTSGVDYRRWQAEDGSLRHHIINPKTGACAETDVLAVTIAHPEATLAEAYTKAVLILGSNTGLGWLSSRWQGAAFVIRQDGAVLATSDFISFISSSSFDGGN